MAIQMKDWKRFIFIMEQRAINQEALNDPNNDTVRTDNDIAMDLDLKDGNAVQTWISRIKKRANRDGISNDLVTEWNTDQTRIRMFAGEQVAPIQPPIAIPSPVATQPPVATPPPKKKATAPRKMKFEEVEVEFDNILNFVLNIKKDHNKMIEGTDFTTLDSTVDSFLLACIGKPNQKPKRNRLAEDTMKFFKRYMSKNNLIMIKQP